MCMLCFSQPRLSVMHHPAAAAAKTAPPAKHAGAWGSGGLPVPGTVYRGLLDTKHRCRGGHKKGPRETAPHAGYGCCAVCLLHQSRVKTLTEQTDTACHAQVGSIVPKAPDVEAHTHTSWSTHLAQLANSNPLPPASRCAQQVGCSTYPDSTRLKSSTEAGNIRIHCLHTKPIHGYSTPCQTLPHQSGHHPPSIVSVGHRLLSLQTIATPQITSPNDASA